MTLTDPTNLRIPGPTPVPPQVIEAMSQPMVPHRGEEFGAMFSELLQQLKRIHNTEHDVFVIAGTGSVGWEVSIVNIMAPGDTVIAAVNGNFGVRFVEAASYFGVNVVQLDFEWGSPVDPDRLKAALAEHPEVKAVQVVHNETSTGVLNPMKEIGQVVREHGAALIADSVSGAAGAPVYMDEWNCDIIFSGSQKAFMCPPGLTIFGVNERIWPLVEAAPMPRYTFNLQRIRDAARNGSTPATAPISLLRGLKAACDMIEAEGQEALYARHERLAEHTRKGLTDLGLELLAKHGYASPTVTVVKLPEGMSAKEVQQAMLDRHGIHIATGQGYMADSVLRIGHMGWTDTPELDRTIAALDDVLEHVPAVV